MRWDRFPPLLLEVTSASVIGFVIGCAWGHGLLGSLLFLVGIGAGSAFLAGSWFAIKLFSSFVEKGSRGTFSMAALFLAMGLKLPIVVGFFLILQTGLARFQSCFLWGVGLVYCVLFGWGMSPGFRAKKNNDNES